MGTGTIYGKTNTCSKINSNSFPERYTAGTSIAEVLLSHSKILPETNHYHHLWGKAGITY